MICAELRSLMPCGAAKNKTKKQNKIPLKKLLCRVGTFDHFPSSARIIWIQIIQIGNFKMADSMRVTTLKQNEIYPHFRSLIT